MQQIEVPEHLDFFFNYAKHVNKPIDEGLAKEFCAEKKKWFIDTALRLLYPGTSTFAPHLITHLGTHEAAHEGQKFMNDLTGELTGNLTRQTVEDLAKKVFGIIAEEPDSSSSQLPGISVEEEEVIQTFQREFDDPAGSLEHLYQTIVKYLQEFDFEHCFPGAALIQTSGSGKSRTATALTQKDVEVIYLSFLLPRSSGYPK
ncbi:hypothetical protein HK102_000114 [Quaeritorhiza haematococci]|nr:hypothetical protein HK102_000114 [Quaeritorhiza haematococci]